MVFIAAYVSPKAKQELASWAKEEDRSVSNLITRLIREDLEKSGFYPATGRENEPQRKTWPEITLAPPVKLQML
jgi:hypothetical protein